MSPKLFIHKEELGRFLVAYHRNLFPADFNLGLAFCAFYNINDYKEIKNELDDQKALNMIVKEFCGRLMS